MEDDRKSRGGLIASSEKLGHFYELRMMFNVAGLLEVVGWALDVFQVLGRNPEFFERSEVVDLLCCVPYQLLARAFTSLLGSLRFRLATHVE